VSRDGGVSWREYGPARGLAPDSVSALDGRRAFFTEQGTVWSTRDGGRTWTEPWPRLPTP
jgi:photosystem II stability/assembly factor-like uncharacterized protein